MPLQITVDGEEIDDAAAAEIRVPVQDGVLVWKFGTREVLRALLDHDGIPINHQIVDHDEIAEEIWYG